MEKVTKIIKIIISAILVLAAVYMVILCIPEKKQHYDMVFMGDSIFGNYRDDTSIPALYEQLSGRSSYNAGLGGTQASMYTHYSNRDVIQNGTSLVSMARAACFNDYTYVRASLPVLNVASLTYFPESVDGSSRVDFASAKYIIIEYGLNDFFADREGRSGDKDTDIATYEGALRYSVRLLKEHYPDVKIVIATQVGCYDDIGDFVEAAKTVASEEDTYLFDAYGLGIVTKENIEKITEDNVHLNEEGRNIYANLLYEYIKGLE